MLVVGYGFRQLESMPTQNIARQIVKIFLAPEEWIGPFLFVDIEGF